MDFSSRKVSNRERHTLKGVAVHTVSTAMDATFLKNIGYSFFGRFWNVLLSLILTPFIISMIGVRDFGVYVLMESIIVYFGFLDIGFGTSFSKYIAEYKAKEEIENLSRVVTIGLFFYVIVGLIILAVAFISKEWVLTRFNFGTVPPDVISFVFTCFVFMLIIRLNSGIFDAVITGFLRFDIYNRIKIMTSTLYFAGVIFVLFYGFGLKGLAVNSIVYAIADFITMFIAAYILIPQLEIRFRKNMIGIFFSLFKFGSTMQVASIAEMINAQVDKLLLGALRNVSVVGLYEVGAKIANMANLFPAVILPILNPTTSSLYARGMKDEINSFYTKGIKIMSAILFPVMLMVIFYAEDVVLLWIGRTGFEQSATAARFLIIGIGLYMIAGVGRIMARGIGIPQYEMQSSLLISILNIILSYFMITMWGIYGAIISSSISLLAGSALFLIKFNNKLKVSNKKILMLISVPAILSSISVLPTLLLPHTTKILFLSNSSLRAKSFTFLAISFIIAMIPYSLIIYFTGFLKEEIKQTVYTVLRRK